MKDRLHLGLQVQVRDRLSDPIRDRGHAEHSRPAHLLRYLDRPDRRRHVAPRGHPVPDLVEVVPKVRLKHLDRLLVNPFSSPVGLDSSPCLPDQPLGNRKRLAVRFRLAHPVPPASPRLTIDQARMTLPLRSSPITEPSSLLRVGPPLCPASVLNPSRISRLELSLPRTTAGHNRSTGRPRARDDRFPRSTPEPRPSSRHLHAGHHLASKQAPARLIPGHLGKPGFDVVCRSFRHVNNGSLSLVFLAHT